MSSEDNDLSASMALLTPEERAAIAGDDADPGDQKALEAVIKGQEALAAAQPDGDDDDEAADTEGGTTDAAPAPAAAPAPSPAAAPAPAASPAAAPAPAPAAAAVEADDLVPAVAAVFVPPLPEDFDARVTAVKTELSELRKQFKAGELDIDEYEDAKEKAEEKRRELEAQSMRHSLARDQAEAAERTAWATGIANLYKVAAKDGIDYAQNESVRGDLDVMLKTLAARQENADKPMGWFLREAHRRVLAMHDIKPANAGAPAAAPTPPARRAPPPLSAVQPSLAQVPGTTGPGDDGTSEYQHLDQLEGDALEDALARMAPRERERYLRMH